MPVVAVLLMLLSFGSQANVRFDKAPEASQCQEGTEAVYNCSCVKDRRMQNVVKFISCPTDLHKFDITIDEALSEDCDHHRFTTCVFDRVQRKR